MIRAHHRRLLGIILLLTTLTASSCATSSFKHTTPDSCPPFKGDILVLDYPPQADILFEEIGVVTGYGGYYHTEGMMISAMKREAARRGANAILIFKRHETPVGEVNYWPKLPFAFVGTAKTIKAYAVQITDGEVPAPK